MDLSKISIGKNPPQEINVVIEITGGSSGGSPVKYEFDKESGGIFVDRIVNTSMFIPVIMCLYQIHCMLMVTLQMF